MPACATDAVEARYDACGLLAYWNELVIVVEMKEVVPPRFAHVKGLGEPGRAL